MGQSGHSVLFRPRLSRDWGKWPPDVEPEASLSFLGLLGSQTFPAETLWPSALSADLRAQEPSIAAVGVVQPLTASPQTPSFYLIAFFN